VSEGLEPPSRGVAFSAVPHIVVTTTTTTRTVAIIIPATCGRSVAGRGWSAV